MKTRRQRAIEAVQEEQHQKSLEKEVLSKGKARRRQSPDEKEKQNKRLKKKRIIQQQAAKVMQEDTVVETKQQKPKKQKKAAIIKVAQQKQIRNQPKKVILKGKVPVDEGVSLNNVHVLEHDGKVYSSTLNQTKMNSNSNKFYMIQVLQSDDQRNFYFWTRWGRVGYDGQNAMIGPVPMNRAIDLYNEKYREKAIKGDYTQLEMNYEDESAQTQQKDEPKKQNAKDYDQSQLETRVKELVKLIFDIKMMNQQMKEIGYDADKLPLGKLSEANIMKGYEVLKELFELVTKTRKKKNNEEAQIEQLNNEFYSLIPHDFGFQKMKYFMLDTAEKIRKKLTMLESLAEIKVATNILDNADKTANQIDSNYAKLNREIKTVSKTSKEYELIEEYVKNTHAETHRAYRLEIVDVFKLKCQFQQKRYTKQIPNKMLLWHGSRLTNYVGILSQGLRIAPPEAPVTGYMFGKGVYFADMVSKSANYCFTNRQNNTGIMLLCEVALGDMNEKMEADAYANNLPPGKMSTKGVGKTFPPVESYVEHEGVQIPLGKPETKPQNCSLLYNEYIVYKVEQVKLKYLLRLKFHYN